MTPIHQPVMLAPVLDALAPQDGATYIDATFGRGGHTAAILDAADCHVLAIDRDPDAIAAGGALTESFSGRLTLLSGRFSQLATLASQAGLRKVDGVLFDLGLSSPQIDEVGRGFSFKRDGPLDMRMEKQGMSAEDFVNEADAAEIATVLREYGEERSARRIARAITAAREAGRITRTAQLADIIRDAMPSHRKNKGGGGGSPAKRDASRNNYIDPATRTFQAIRIRINNELEELKAGLVAAEKILKPGGVLAVIAFHSLEDRIVKRFLVMRSGAASLPSRHLPLPADPPAPSFRLKRKHPTLPAAGEVIRNKRARSARLRTAIRTRAPAMPEYPDSREAA